VSGLSAQDLFNPKQLPSDWMFPPILKQRLLALAGEGAMNCGHASQSSLAPADVTDCALHQFQAKKRFYVRYDLDGFDSEQGVGFAFDGQKLYTVTWQRMMGWSEQTLRSQECPAPIDLAKTPLGRLTCHARDWNDQPYFDL
jgi:hypothetical protein